MLMLLCTPFVTAFAAKPPETKADYLALKGQNFTVNRIEKGQDVWSKSVDLKLIEITESTQDKSGRTDQFILRFQAANKDKALDKTVYRFEHVATGPFTLFLEPAGGDKKYRYYQAIFNLLKKD
jgi:hypothetical protein